MISDSDLIKENRIGADEEDVAKRNVEHRCSQMIACNYFNKIPFLV